MYLILIVSKSGKKGKVPSFNSSKVEIFKKGNIEAINWSQINLF